MIWAPHSKFDMRESARTVPSLGRFSLFKPTLFSANLVSFKVILDKFSSFQAYLVTFVLVFIILQPFLNVVNRARQESKIVLHKRSLIGTNVDTRTRRDTLRSLAKSAPSQLESRFLVILMSDVLVVVDLGITLKI